MNAMPLSAAEVRDAMRQGHTFDAARLNRILGLDAERGLLEVQSATPWAVIAAQLRPGDARAAGVASTALRTVADSLACNPPGPDGDPSVKHVHALTLVTPDGDLRRLSRRRDPELFSLVVGGFGLFGTLYSITLRIDSLTAAVEKASPPKRVVLRAAAPMPRPLELLLPPEHVERFIADSDLCSGDWRVPLSSVDLRRTGREEDSFLRWASRDFAEVKLHFSRCEALGSQVRLAQLRRELIDVAIASGGRFPIASTREATRAQAAACYPQLPAFLEHKRRFDPHERLTNRWYLHQRRLLAGGHCEVRWGG